MNPQQLSSSHPLFKTKLCSHWQRGFCLYGSMCQFAHGEQELRQIQKHRASRHHHHEMPLGQPSNGPSADPRSRLSFDEVAARRASMAFQEPGNQRISFDDARNLSFDGRISADGRSSFERASFERHSYEGRGPSFDEQQYVVKIT